MIQSALATDNVALFEIFAIVRLIETGDIVESRQCGRRNAADNPEGRLFAAPGVQSFEDDAFGHSAWCLRATPDDRRSLLPGLTGPVGQVPAPDDLYDEYLNELREEGFIE